MVLKKNKGIVTLQWRNEYNKHTSSRHKDKTDVLREMILEKNPPVAKGVKTQKQTVTRLMGKGCKCS